jgi:hypothetical protein
MSLKRRIADMRASWQDSARAGGGGARGGRYGDSRESGRARAPRHLQSMVANVLMRTLRVHAVCDAAALGLSMHRAPARPIAITRRTFAVGAAAFALADFAPGLALAADPLESGQFRAAVMALMKRARPDLHLVAPLGDPALITIDNRSIYLNNLYSRVSVAPAENRDAIILEFISAMAEAFDHKEEGTFEAARSRLRARLVSAELVAQSGLDK